MYIYIHTCIYIYICINTHTHTHTHIYIYIYIYMDSLVAKTVKNLPTMQETWVQSLGLENPLEKGMATYSSILAWSILWTEEPGRECQWIIYCENPYKLLIDMKTQMSFYDYCHSSLRINIYGKINCIWTFFWGAWNKRQWKTLKLGNKKINTSGFRLLERHNYWEFATKMQGKRIFLWNKL